mmetsp:Transcript_34407/g.61784  ORF Transcript_34407/g.61784 Transcript_34407/m.61784 type:complete len:221 (+) Transcript_34407:53-715(+)|eukprot:CAMPEP_0201877990 /NCGR_PEP_ID=MMETSP0902-20130614/9263_1 /ASSEMBLY_ACC=CAM_ASM_000551 /TAXON_ID=420261 /ORGANISM="Thalassiosira antarctica, Strain CCMP982" /LENGTH=220 /DNA_ID=CAMNT_0048405551 /DNA_START=42 /DNA_END=704 /DNA_ORIENTATION=-
MVNSSIVLLAAMASGATAFSASSVNLPSTVLSSSSAIHAVAPSRRDFFTRTGSVVATTLLTVTSANPAYAADTPPTPEELERIRTGYKNIQYLLANWEAETTVCRENGGECKRNAEAVRKYLGLRSTLDPLFQIEKVFAKVRFMDDIDPDKLDEFFDATEVWNTTMNMSNSMAFISQFAEYNPGGGKDEVKKYLDEAQTQVVLAESALKTILDCVNSSPA